MVLRICPESVEHHPHIRDPIKLHIYWNYLYLGTYRVYQTTNGAGNWTAISGGLGNTVSFR